MKSGLLILLLVLIFVSSTYAQDYYADVIISIDNAGLTTISGETNHHLLDVEDSTEFTSKNGKHWIVNVSTDDYFSNFIYELKLPKNAVVNYMKMPEFARIEDSSSGLSIIGTGKNQKFSIVVQYSINSYNSANYLWLYVIIVFVIFGVGYYLLKKKNKKPKPKLPAMALRQKTIYEILVKNKKSMTQKQIQDITHLPKSSISRNIETMVKKGLLKKEQVGMSNLISINEDSA
jgi:hypothetical protein